MTLTLKNLTDPCIKVLCSHSTRGERKQVQKNARTKDIQEKKINKNRFIMKIILKLYPNLFNHHNM